MSYVEATAYASGAYVPAIIRVAHVYKATQGDGCWFKDEAGVIPIQGCLTSNATLGATFASNFTYNSIMVNNAGTAYTATSTQIVYDNWSGLGAASQRSTGNYYIYNGSTNEIMYVVKDSAPTVGLGTLDVIRGCLGTTAAVPANDNYLMVMNSLTMPLVTAGAVMIFYIPMPTDPKATFTGVPTTGE
jgi:hypothetical protein